MNNYPSLTTDFDKPSQTSLGEPVSSRRSYPTKSPGKLEVNQSTNPEPQKNPTLDVGGLYAGQIFGKSQATNQAIDAWRNWQADPTPKNMSPLLSQLKPAINKSTQKYTGSSDQLAISTAKQLVAKAIPRYDESKASLETFVDRQLQPLIRWQSRRSRQIRLPDRMQLEAGRLAEATKDLIDQNNRQPSNRQLADYTGLPLKRIEAIRTYDKNLLTSSGSMGSGENAINNNDLPVDHDKENALSFMKFIRDDLGPIDQTILEHTVGLEGAPIWSNSKLAKNLRLSPGAISQRKARIQAILDKETTLGLFR